MPENTVTRRVPVSLKSLDIATGTWTYTNTAGLLYLLKTATDETSVITYTLPIPRRSDQFGIKLKFIYNPIRVTTASLDAAPTSVIYRNDFDLVVAGASGDVATATVETTDNGVVTLDANDRMLITTVTTPEWDYSTEAEANYTHSLSLNCAATTVVRIYPPIVVYDELV